MDRMDRTHPIATLVFPPPIFCLRDQHQTGQEAGPKEAVCQDRPERIMTTDLQQLGFVVANSLGLWYSLGLWSCY